MKRDTKRKPEHRPAIDRITGGCPQLYQKAYARATAGAGSPRGAIKVMCLHCCGWERAESAKCTAYGCPLWCFNPWRIAAERLAAQVTKDGGLEKQGTDGR